MTAPSRSARSTAASAADRRTIWVLVSRLQRASGLSREDAELVMRGIVREVTGGESTRGLSAVHAARVAHELDLRIQSAAPARRDTTDPDRPTTRAARAAVEDSGAIVTPAQQHTLERLARAIGWTGAQLRAWAKGRMASVTQGRPWPQTRGEALALHEGLEAMLWRLPGSRPAQVVARAEAALQLPDLTPWEEDFLRDLVAKGGRLRRQWKPLVKLHEIEGTRGGRDGG